MNQRRLIDDCFFHDKDRLRHDDALAILKSRLAAIVGRETVPLDQASRRILAEEIIAPRNVPLNDNAAVDGYAFSHADFDNVAGRFPVSARIAAGDKATSPLQPNTAVRIFTGAEMPAGADCVVMQEDCQLAETGKTSKNEIVIIPPGLKKGANRRLAGEDAAAGDKIMSPGISLRPQDIAAIASTGKAKIKVYAKLKVALISTGNELRRPGQTIADGQVYDSNHHLLDALLAQTLNVEITDCGILADNAEAVGTALREISATHDVIITSGGVSRGEEDHIIASLDKLGSRYLWQLAIKPGRPMTFGQIVGGDHQCLLFGLPGNPVAAMVCFLLYVKPSLEILGGGNWHLPTRYPLPAAFEITNKKPDRREFLRGLLQIGSDGRPVIAKYRREGSGIISSLTAADGLIEIDEATTSIKIGQLVNFIPFGEFGIC